VSGASWLRRNVVYPLWVAKDRSPRLRYLRELERTQYLEPAQLKELQVRKLLETIEHAYREAPYYTRLFDSLGLRPADFRDERDLKKLPVLSKDQVRLH